MSAPTELARESGSGPLLPHPFGNLFWGKACLGSPFPGGEHQLRLLEVSPSRQHPLYPSSFTDDTLKQLTKEALPILTL